MPDDGRMSRRVVLRDDVSSAEVRAFSLDVGWTFLGEIDRDVEQGIFYEAKWDSGDGGSVHYVVDEFVDACYFVAAHHDRRAAEAALARVEAGLATWTVDEMLEDCDINVYPAGWAKAVLRLGAGAPLEAVLPVRTRITESTAHRDAPVRRAAVWAMIYAGWPEFADDLARLADEDADSRVAQEARLALEQLVGSRESGA